MGKKDKADKDNADKAGEGGKKKSPLVIGGLCIALAGVGYMLGGRKAGAQEGSAPTTTIDQLEGCAPGTDAAEVEHRTVDLESMSINLTDDHYLRVTVGLALCPGVVVSEAEPFPTAPAKDIIVSTLSGNSMTVLGEPSGREQAKELLTEQIADAYPEEIYEVYFLEFVMQ